MIAKILFFVALAELALYFLAKIICIVDDFFHRKDSIPKLDFPPVLTTVTFFASAVAKYLGF